MSNLYTIQESTLTDIASSIRKKTNSIETLTPREMATAINNIYQSGIVFTSSKNSIEFDCVVKGSISIFVNDELIGAYNEDSHILLENTQNKICRIERIENLIELNMANQGIDTFQVFSYTPLTKLVVYENNISKLDLIYCTELKYLHFYSNPICDNDIYKDNLIQCIMSLPNRVGKSLGSIILYPWYGLETLICETDGKYVKYPSLDAKEEYSLVEHKLYGLVGDEGNITYYLGGRNRSLEPYQAMNRHHMLRKWLEISEQYSTLKKNWMFGSAIQYHPDYEYCHYYFRDIGVQDVWETAEKGFGICIGSIDRFTGNALGWNDMNVKAYLDFAGNLLSPYKYGDASHGDFILSQIVGRGDGVSYGICPNASIYVIDYYTSLINATSQPVQNGEQWRDSIRRITENCNSYTSSFNVGYTKTVETEAIAVWADARRILGEFGNNNIITCSAGNNGDGLPWTEEVQTTKAVAYGNFGTEDDLLSTKYHTNTFYIASLNPLREASVYSNSSVSAQTIIPTIGYTDNSTIDYLSSYGEQIKGYNTHTKDESINQGTSMSSPNCNATLALMRIIYQKMYPNNTSFGKFSDFIQYVRDNWIDPIAEKMAFSVGAGIPCFNTEPQKVCLKSIAPLHYSYPSDCMVGEPFNIVASVSQGAKNKLTYAHNFLDYAVLNNEQLVPLCIRGAEINRFDVYTNTALNLADLTTNYFKKNISINIFNNTKKFTLLNNSIQSTLVDNYWRWQNDSIKNFTVHVPIYLSMQAFYTMFPQNGNPNTAFDGYISFVSRMQEKGLTELFYLAWITAVYDANGQLAINIPTTVTTSSGSKSNKVNMDIASYCTIKRFPIQVEDKFILTGVFDEVEGIAWYINGNLLNKSITYSIAPSELYISKTFCESGAIFYDRKLTHEQIINNTVYLLQEKEIAE